MVTDWMDAEAIEAMDYVQRHRDVANLTPREVALMVLAFLRGRIWHRDRDSQTETQSVKILSN